MKVKLVGQVPLIAPISGAEMWEQPEAQPGLDHHEEIGRQERLPEIGPIDLDQPPRDVYPHGLHPGSPVEAMRNRLKDLELPIYGTKQELWRRLVQQEVRATRQDWQRQELARQLEERRAGRGQGPVVSLPEPLQPTDGMRRSTSCVVIFPGHRGVQCVSSAEARSDLTSGSLART